MPRTGISSGTLRSVIEYGLYFTFTKVVWQHMQGVMGFFNDRFIANLPENQPVKTF